MANLYNLGLESKYVEKTWRRLHNKPVGEVRRLIGRCEGKPLDRIWPELVKFGKDVKPVD